MVLAPLPPSAVVLAQSSPVCIQVSNLSGQGNHVLQDGRRGVLREEIAAYLEGLGLPAALATGNDGMLIVRAQDLHRWIASTPAPALGPAGADSIAQ